MSAMELNDILYQVNEIFKRIFENENIVVKMETTASDVDKWDSLNHTVMISAVEKHFNVRFSLKEMLGFQNVGDMVRTVQKKLQAS